MRKAICTIALTGLLGLGMTAFGQDQSTTSSTQSQAYGHQHTMDPNKKLEHLTKTLNLTPDQQAQIKPILQDQQQRMMQIHNDTSLSQDDRMAKKKSLKQDTRGRIEAVLNPDQKQKYEAMKQKKQQGAEGTQPSSQPQQ